MSEKYFVVAKVPEHGINTGKKNVLLGVIYTATIYSVILWILIKKLLFKNPKKVLFIF